MWVYTLLTLLREAYIQGYNFLTLLREAYIQGKPLLTPLREAIYPVCNTLRTLRYTQSVL